MMLANQDRKLKRAAWFGTEEASTRDIASEIVVTEVGLLARQDLRDGSSGWIVAVFERSLYALVNDNRICVGAREIGSGPLQLICTHRLPSGLAPGDTVAVVGPTLWIKGIPFTRLEAASTWIPEAVPHWTVDSLRDGLRGVDAIWRDRPTEVGLAAAGYDQQTLDASQFLEAAKPGVTSLIHIVEAGFGRSISSDSSGLASLVGLGPGLTPSGDDLICGALIALTALNRADLRDALWEKCRGLLGRTNEISRSHMQAAALGYGASALHAALHATMSGRVEQLYPAIAALATIGHTSGRDAFAGALIVLRCFARHFPSGTAYSPAA
jgi:hypothetical protein